MILNALLCYAVAAALPVAALIAAVLFLKKSGKKISALHTFIGAVSFIVMLAGMFALMLFAFAEMNVVYMTAYMSEAFYKILVTVIFFLAVGVVRYYVLNAVYFNRYKEDNGVSFLLGYGICGGLIISLYCLFMFFLTLCTSLSSPLVQLSEESVLIFESGSNISVFTPFYAHILFAVIFVLYCAFMLVLSMFMTYRSAHPYKWYSTLGMYITIQLCELLAVMMILFASTSISPLALVVIFVLLTVVSALTVKLLYRYKDEQPYTKQFE